jgi:very-short-patch-repair endonuclease
MKGEEMEYMQATKENYNLYNKSLQPFANENRKEMTKAEACLWKYALRAKQMGYTFNRQRPVMNYIADFMCKPLKLIIEVDGYSHSLENVIKKDIIRQNALEKAGFKVIRFSDKEVLTQIIQVRTAIFEVIQQLEIKMKESSPLLPLGGGHVKEQLQP